MGRRGEIRICRDRRREKENEIDDLEKDQKASRARRKYYLPQSNIVDWSTRRREMGLVRHTQPSVISRSGQIVLRRWMRGNEVPPVDLATTRCGIHAPLL